MADRPSWSAAAAYPTERYTLPEGYHFEVESLIGGRGRINATDGHTHVSEFW